MTEEKDETLKVTVLEDAVKLIDLGDAVEETKQPAPDGTYPDCILGFSKRWGCGG